MPDRKFVLLFVCTAASCLLAAPAGGANVRLQITRWDINTVHNHKQTVHSGATITFCANDPYYGITPVYVWADVPFSRVMTLTASQPQLKPTTFHQKIFSASGQNGDTINARTYGVAAKSLPPGKYSFRVSVAGAQTSGSITLVEKTHC
jgi:hypothetical protein